MENLESAPTVRFAPVPAGPEPSSAGRRRRRRVLVGAGVVVGALAVVYGVDVLVSQGAMSRGVTVAGVDVGGLSRADAERRLHDALDSRIAKPIKVRAGDVAAELDPKTAGLAPNWPATLEQAAAQPLNPFARLTSFFERRDSPFVSTVDDVALGKALEGLKVDRDPVEGTIQFDGVRPKAVTPRSGQKLDAAAAKRSVVDSWVNGNTVPLPVTSTAPKVSADAVREAVENYAKPAVSAPVTVKGEGRDATLQPEAIAAALGFTPGDNGKLTPKLDHAKIVDALRPQLAGTEQPGRDAQVVIEGDKPTVRPSVDGRGVDWDKSLTGLGEVLPHKDKRVVTAQYAKQPAKLTTEQANQLGIREVVGEFTTGGFAADSGVNIRQVAAKVDGAVVKPGETFSLNGFTGPRGAKQGYVEAGIIENGAPGKAVGGGISQFATTLYNASYFAGMADAGHTEHSYYISRYPAAREATVFQNPDGSSVIDLKFRNDGPTGVAIQTIWTPQSITVRLWGTKRYQVESIPGERTGFVEPQPRPGPAVNCHPSAGGPGFTATDTRVIRDLAGHEVSRHTRKKVYDPAPKITCG